MSTIRRFLSEERGVTLVLVVFMMIVIFGFAAMAIDVGDVLWNRHALQNAVDAAALAGVRELPEDPEKARAVARQYLEDNLPGVTDITIDIQVTTLFEVNPNDSIIVTATRRLEGGLRQAVGGGDINVPAVAQAVVAESVNMCEIWPWGIAEADAEDIEYGVPVTMKVVPGNKYSPGNFGALDLDGHPGGGEGDYEERVKHKGCVTSLTIRPENGNMGQNNYDAVQGDPDSIMQQCLPKPGYRYKLTDHLPDCVYWQDPDNPPYSLGCPNDPKCGFCTEPAGAEVQVPSCARVGIVPIIDEFPNGNGPITIKRFAAFYLIGVEGPQESQVEIRGAFLRSVTVKGGQPNHGVPLGSLRGHFLWR